MKIMWYHTCRIMCWSCGPCLTSLCLVSSVRRSSSMRDMANPSSRAEMQNRHPKSRKQVWACSCIARSLPGCMPWSQCVKVGPSDGLIVQLANLLYNWCQWYPHTPLHMHIRMLHGLPGALAMEALHRQVLPFLLRRMKEDVLQDLPPKIIQDYHCELSPLQVCSFYMNIMASEHCFRISDRQYYL